jgi:hypothetical protein
MKRIVGLWWVHLMSACIPVFAQVDTTFIYNTSMPYGTLDIRVAKSATRYYVLQEDTTFSYRESSPGVRTWTYRDMTAWNSAPFRQGNLRERIITNNGRTDNFVMNYRFLMPLNYNPDYDPGYPIILMMHGLGERGNCWDNRCYWSTPGWNPITNSPPAPTTETHNLLNNDHNLLHGGQKHLAAVQAAAGKLPNDPTLLPTAFPGFVLFPQNLNGWGSAQRVEDVIRILRLIIKKYNIDENRVYIHGLSNGGGAVYQAIKRAPWLFAAALPMSAISNGGIISDNLQAEVGKIPIWQFQGGKDHNPTPSRTFNTIKAFRDAGAVIRYSYYAHLGHGTWNTAYNEPDFFSWILAKRKYNPHVYYGNPVICNTTGAGVRIAYSKGFRAYQWEQDGQIIPGATTPEITTNTPGTYRGRFSRKANPQSESDWEPWSDPIVVTEISPAQPKIVPLTSTHLRGPGLLASEKNNTVILESADQADLYTWYKNGTKIDFPITDIDDTLRRASFFSGGTGANGAYTLKTWYSYCPSPSSEPLNLFYNNSAPQNISLSAPAVDLKGTIQESGVFLTWNDVLSNELAYEIWRRKAGTNEFSFAGRTERDGISFFDSPLEPLTTYEYKLRAVNNTGASNYIPSNDLNVNYQITTPADNIAPGAPQQLRMVHNDIHQITLSWLPAEDNTGIREYIINYDGKTISTDSAVTTFTIYNLQQNISFPVSVQAVDHGGNLSPESNTIIGSTYVLGLFYKHSTGGWEDLDDTTLTETWINPEFTGFVNNITLAPRTQEDFFNFQFTGYLDITNEGDYVFQVTSNDGGRLLLDDSILVDVDGVHGNVTKQSNPIHLLSGPHRFEVQFFEYSGGQNLIVQYQGPDSKDAMKALPDSVFRSGKYNQPAATPPPTNLAAQPSGLQRIDLSWEVSEGLQVELYRADAEAGPFSIIAKTTAKTHSDTVNLTPEKTYYYKARSVSANGLSAFTATISASTMGDAEPPSAPQNLVVSNISHTGGTISWDASTDNVAVKSYEVFVNNAPAGTTEIAAFTATDLLPGTSYTVYVKAVDQNNNKSDSSAVTFSTSSALLFYSRATGNLNEVSAWSSTADGSGASPVSFEENAQFFIVSNRTSASLAGPLTIGGSASKLVVPAGVALTADYPLIANVELEGDATLVLNDSIAPTLQKISATSTVEFNGPVVIPSLDYGNLIISGGGMKTLESDTTQVEGDWIVKDSVVVKGSAGNASILIVNGNIAIENTDAIAADNRIDLRFTSGKDHAITTGDHLSFFRLAVGAGSNVSIGNLAGAVRLRLGSLNGGGLSIQSGSSLNIGRNSLELTGAATLNSNGETGTLGIDGGDIRITSSSAVNNNLYLSQAAATVDSLFMNTTSSANFVIQNPLRITGGIKIKAGQLNSAGNITLVSTADKTASIMEIENNGSIAGNIRVQHYISTVGEKWIGLSTPVNGVTIANWQQYFPVYGQFIGSSGAGEASVLVSNGTDLVPYPPAGGSNTAPLERGKGYYTKLNATTPIVLEEFGVPFQGNVPFTITSGSGGGAANGWNLVGNPYASPIEWNLNTEAWMKNGISNIISIKEKKVVNGQPVSQFKYFDPSLKSITIKAGDAFWIHSYAGGSALLATEKAKRLKKFNGQDSVSHVVISLMQGSESDDAYVLFTDSGTDAFDNQLDGLKRLNEGMFSFSTLQDNISLAVNNLSNTFCSKAVKLNLVNTPAGTYALKFSNLDKLIGVGSVRLLDNFTKATTAINSSNTMYQFTVSTDAASYGANRFVVTFERQSVDLTSSQVTAETVCSDVPAFVTVTQSQSGIEYSAVNSDGQEISNSVQGNGSTISLEIPNAKLVTGQNHIRVRAGFEGCGTQYLASETDITFIPPFEVSTEPDVSICTGEQAMLQASGVPSGGSYRWYDENQVLIDSVSGSRFVTAPITQEKVYYVSGVHSGGCESEKKSIHVFADTLDTPVIIMQNDTLFVQGEANFQWKQGNDIIPGADKPFYKPFSSGSYSVIASIGGCVRESGPFQYTGANNCQFNVTAPVAKVDNNCGSDMVALELTNTQSGVRYVAVNSQGAELCAPVVGNGATITLELTGSMLSAGTNTIKFQAEFEGCESKMLATQATFNYTAGFSAEVTPEIEACKGDNVVIEASGAPAGGWYHWYDEHYNILQGSMGGTYVVPDVFEPVRVFVSAVHPNGCESAKKQIYVYLANDSLEIKNINGILHATGETGGTYQWKLNGTQIYAAVDSTYAPTETGKYSVVFTKNGCTTESEAIEYTLTAVVPVISEFVLNTFPVPSTPAAFRVSVQSPGQDLVIIRILDSTGKSVYRNSYLPDEIFDPVPITPEHGPLKEGMYLIIATQGKEEIRRRIIISN